jgi:co-chaperonin GroES (HSP10)
LVQFAEVGDQIQMGSSWRKRHWAKWSRTEVDRENLLIMTESDVMGVVEGTVAFTRKAA